MTHLERPEAIRDIQSGDVNRYGHWFWDELFEVVDKIPCSTCKAEGKAGIQALRDAIAVTKGRDPYDPQGLVRVSKFLEGAVTKCHHMNKCSPPSAKFERCVTKVKASGTAQNPFAVCHATLG